MFVYDFCDVLSLSRNPCSIGQNKDTFSKLLVFSVALFSFGLIPFYLISRTDIGAYFATTQSGRDSIGAIIGVLLTNVIIAFYVYSAFNEPPDPPRPPQQKALNREKTN